MQIKATVHTVAPIDVPTQVEHGGQKIMAKVPMLAVELVTDDADQKNPMFNAPMDDESWLKTGARVTITIAPENAK